MKFLSNTKLGLLVLWPTFWTGVPLKLVIGLLLLAGGLHPWEGTGLSSLLFLSIPIDMWALGLCARTVLLERLHVEPKPGLGIRLWWQWALLSVLYLPALYYIVAAVVTTAKSLSSSIIEFLKENVMAIHIAEQITLDLVLWGSVATLVLLFLLVGWLFGLGALLQREVRGAVSKEGTFQEMVSGWDSLRIPSDQGLLLTAFAGGGLVLTLVFWGLMPVMTPHPHEEYEYTYVKKVERPVQPKEVLKKTKKVLAKAKLVIEELEKKKKEKKKDAEPNGDGKKIPKTKPGNESGPVLQSKGT